MTNSTEIQEKATMEVGSRDSNLQHGPHVALLTGGDDKSYAVGLTMSLAALNVFVDFIGSDTVDSPTLHGNEWVRFLNLRRSQLENVPLLLKVRRVLLYYFRLIAYALTARAKVFHILWNNKFEFCDRVLLMVLYRALGKHVILTAHNVNAAKRDNCDNAFNRWTLRVQYRLSDHIFVHTEKMRLELLEEYGVAETRTTVIPFGINSVFPSTAMNRAEARKRLGLQLHERVVLFFGQIAAYKGLEHLVDAFVMLMQQEDDFRLVIAGKVKRGQEVYWARIRSRLSQLPLCQNVLQVIRFIPDEEVEIYFKAADVLAIPYVQIFQSGVPFLGFNFGLPVVATDVGSLKEDIAEGTNGMICRPRDSVDLAGALKAYFQSAMYLELEARRPFIRSLALERHSWMTVARITRRVYEQVLETGRASLRTSRG